MNKIASLNMVLVALMLTGTAAAGAHEEKPVAKPAASTAAQHNMAGMDHSKMEGMDHSKMAGMDHAAMAKAQFVKFDKNKDGFVTKAELPEDMRAHFSMMDTNKNGKLTQAEMASMHKK